MNENVNPQLYARFGGALYMGVIVLGIFQEAVVRGRVTPGNLKSMEMLWRTGIVVELVMMILSIAMAVIFFVLLRPVHRELALMALLFNAIAIAVESAYTIQLVEALFPLGTSSYLTAFTPAQLHAITALAMKAHIFGFGVALLLFAPFLLLAGYLMFRSGFLPKTLGVLYAIAGLAYLVNGFALLLAPQFSGRVFLFIAGPAFVGEAAVAVWLLIRGIDVARWRSL